MFHLVAVLEPVFDGLMEDPPGGGAAFVELAAVPEGEMAEVIISRNIGWSKECEMWYIPVQWILLPIKEVIRRGGVIAIGVCAKLFTRI